MKVKATQLGFYRGKLREKGDVFDIEEGLFSNVWMEKIDETEEKRPRGNPYWIKQALEKKEREERAKGNI